MSKNNDFAIARKPTSAVEKAAPRAKRILSGMVNDTLALRKMKLERPVHVLFSAGQIIPKLKANERFAAIREMVTHLIDVRQIRPQDEAMVVDSFITREKLMSTGFGFGCASPRSRVSSVSDIILVVGISTAGIDFDALDGQPVKIFTAFVAPANSYEHEAELQRFGAEIARTLHKVAVREQLLHSKSTSETWSILKPIYDEIYSKK